MRYEILRKPEEWARDLGIEILDPDGWRAPIAKDFDALVTAAEFDRRVIRCTIRITYADGRKFGPTPKAVELNVGGAS